MEDLKPAPPAALQDWEDSNYPYRLPDDLRAFLASSDGFSLSWGASLRDNREGRVGHLHVNRISEMKRIPLDADDLKIFAELPPAFHCSIDNGFTTSPAPVHDRGSCNIGGNERYESYERKDGFSVAAFALDSHSDVGRVALVYKTPASVQPGELRREGLARGLANPAIWLQDLACGWHFMADGFSSYFRLIVVHLGVLGWQHAYTPMGFSPATQQWMRLYCPDRLLFDQMEWRKERARLRCMYEEQRRQRSRDAKGKAVSEATVAVRLVAADTSSNVEVATKTDASRVSREMTEGDSRPEMAGTEVEAGTQVEESSSPSHKSGDWAADWYLDERERRSVRGSPRKRRARATAAAGAGHQRQSYTVGDSNHQAAGSRPRHALAGGGKGGGLKPPTIPSKQRMSSPR
ncbi:unnamed protein product [Choristocarpus tenellus]